MLDIQRNGDFGSESKEFNFWDDQRVEKYDKDADSGSSGLEFQTKTSDSDAYSPTFWATSTRHEATNLLQQHSQYSVRSPTSRLQVMVDDRRVITNMVQNMPESSFELSLRDIVDDRTNMNAGEKKIEKKKCVERTKMVRSQSMDSGVFLLKMFLPACLSAKKKSTSGICSRASPGPSFDGSKKPVEKEWWSMMFLVSRRKINNCSSNSSSRSSGSIHNRYVHSVRCLHYSMTQFCLGIFRERNHGKKEMHNDANASI
ncbi:hypothetical protein DCAR_0416605 [Daucus carota subsp. sativus]|uniref:Uncharacterized protein n=1 Tax=Daucus carota subsp. sativus TaxID=79200 RepID=A0AAF0WW97_DAUCS|nr:hypothetical protein DCAR_0416605 [Daucus carota subsp. sativus]